MNERSKIFINEDFRSTLEIQSKDLSKELIIYSAFVKLNALEWLKSILPNGIEVKIVARWQPNDLTANASDLEAYGFCKQMGWSFGIQNTLHSKVFIFDNKTVLLGSANLTNKGLSISSSGNIEVGTIVDANVSDLSKLKTLEDGVKWLDDDLYEEISQHIASLKIERPQIIEWPDSLKQKILKPIKYLWIGELLWTRPEEILMPDLNNDDHQHDIDMLDLDIQYLSKDLIDQKFINTNIYKFLIEQLEKSDTKYTNFGWFSSVLHDHLLDDPPPYRSDVKHYVDVLIGWLEWSDLSKVKLTKYAHTIGMSLNR